MFHAGWFADLLEGRDRYAELFHRLNDEISRRTLDAVLGYRQTLDPEMLADVTTAWAELYLPAGLFALGRDEVYVDGGTYDGDTVRLFIERTSGQFKKIIAFEPDPATFKRLAANFADEPRVISVNAGLWSRSDTLRFQGDAGRASNLGREGDIEVKVVALDEDLRGENCTFIKMNIEGAELEALKGASETIRRFKPKLAVSAYHRPSDLSEVAHLVDEIAPGYKLYLRQHCGGLVETVLYALPVAEARAEPAAGAESITNFRNAEWVDASLGWNPIPVGPLPERLLIDYATRCNLRCPMCPVWGSEDDQAIASVEGIMDCGAAEAIEREIAVARPLIQPTIYGEPLLIPTLRDRIKSLKEKNISVAFNTNGLTLTDELATFFVEAKVDSIFFSIDAVTPETYRSIRGVDKLAKVEAAVHTMLEARGGSSTPRIGVSFTLQVGNQHEEAAFVERWSHVVDCVRVGQIFENGTFPGLKTPEKRTPCPALYKTLPIHNDGTATICCLDGFKETAIGNVFDSGVQAVWTGEAMAKVRYFHETEQWDKVPFCKPCNGWSQHAYIEEIRDGLLIRRSPEFTYYNRMDRMGNWQGALRGGHVVTINEDAASAI
jgi:FkbM family methyltransferase